MAVGAMLAAQASPAHAYPPQPEDDSGHGSSFESSCGGAVPYVSYSIASGSTGPIVTVRDVNGAIVVSFQATERDGRFVYPGAAVDANGGPADWPGWRVLADGTWVADPTDAHLRNGLTVRVGDGSDTATVSYPADAACNAPVARTSRRAGLLAATGNQTARTLAIAGASLAVGCAFYGATSLRRRRS